MPCYECENGKWKFGQTGKCEYDSKSDCETANKDYYLEQIDKEDMAKKKKYYSDEEHDHHFHFTQEMMETLHEEGELEVKVEEDDKEMLILFTYGEQESEEYTPEEEEEIKDKFEDYFDEVIKSLKDSK
tara:strand:- start:191 stop:577 length:387 start_codon:yes stop_codon:yes gene_type:complete